MLSDSEDEILLGGAALRILVLLQRQDAVHTVNKRRTKCGAYYTLFRELKNHPERFFNYVRMDLSTFSYILEQVSPFLQKKCTNFLRQPISPEERLLVTLR